MCFTENNNSESKRDYGYQAVAVKQQHLQECLYLLYHNACSYETWQGGDLQEGALTHKVK